MIRKITVRNYKSLRDVTVDLDPLTVLIGRSGSGKSNLVNAIRFLREYIEHRGDTFVTQSGGWPKVFCASTPDQTLQFQVLFGIAGFAEDLQYSLALAVDKSRNRSSLLGEHLYVGGRPVFRQSEGKWVVPPDVVTPPAPGTLALGVLYGIPEAGAAHRALTRGIGCYDFPTDVLSKGGRDGPPTKGFEDDGRNFLNAFELVAGDLSAGASLREIVAALRLLNSTVSTVEADTRGTNQIIVGHRVAGGQALAFDLAEESEGFRRFLAHLIALHQLPPKQSLVFEEPEKGIFPAALSLLGEQFQACADHGRSQVILTTHSPQLLESFRPEQIREVRMDGFETKIDPVPPEQIQAIKDQLMTTGELLTVDAAHLDPAAAPE